MNVAIGLVTTTIVLTYARRRVLALVQRAFGDRVLLCAQSPLNARRIALTIDDAPGAYAEEILDLLKTHNFKATFFVIGRYAMEHERIVARIVADGHEIGNHTYDDHATWKLDTAQLVDELRATRDAVHTACEKHGVASPSIRYWRPGCGVALPRHIEAARSEGYRMVLGSVYPFDPHVRSAALITQCVQRLTGGGDIVILHDGRRHTLAALRRLLSYWAHHDMTLVTLSAFR